MRVLQERLQKLAEDELPESQCGFRKGRNCTDMTFTVHQLLENSQEHKAKSFFTIIDLKKAYDSVPREVVWLALEKLGDPTPTETVKLIRSFHEGVKAKIHQGCCTAPVLFNLFTRLTLEHCMGC